MAHVMETIVREAYDAFAEQDEDRPFGFFTEEEEDSSQSGGMKERLKDAVEGAKEAASKAAERAGDVVEKAAQRVNGDEEGRDPITAKAHRVAGKALGTQAGRDGNDDAHKPGSARTATLPVGSA